MVNLTSVISLIENPFEITEIAFSLNTFYNSTLYVPVGTIDKYKSTEGWKDFLFIEEGTGEGTDTPTTQKCEKSTISYSNGKLTFNSATEGATYQYSITDSDIKANAVMIQSNDGLVNVSGIDDGSDIVVYSISGQMINSAKAIGNQVSVSTNLKKGEAAIVKIGEKSVKVVMQ